MLFCKTTGEKGFCWACWWNAASPDWCSASMPSPHEVTHLVEGGWMPIQKPNGGGGVPGTPLEPVGGMLQKQYPTLLEYLSDERYADGSPRVRSTLSVFVELGTVKLCLNDRDQGQTAWASATTLENALKAMEGRLAKGDAEWRASGGPGRGKRK